MGDLTRNIESGRSARIVKRKRRPRNRRKNLYWIGIILIVTLALSALVAVSYNMFDNYFSVTGEIKSSLVPKDLTNKLRELVNDKLTRRGQ